MGWEDGLGREIFARAVQFLEVGADDASGMLRYVMLGVQMLIQNVD